MHCLSTDPEFVHLADCYFSVTILTLMLAKNVAPMEKPGDGYFSP